MNILHSKKFILRFLAVATLAIMVLCRFMSWHEMRITEIDINGIEILDASAGADVWIDELSCKTDTYSNSRLVTINGWCVIKGRATMPIAMHVILIDSSSNVCYKLPTAVITREDVTAAYNDGVNYDYSGFSVYLDSKNLRLDDRQYNVAVLYEIGTDVYLIFSDRYLALYNEEEAMG